MVCAAISLGVSTWGRVYPDGQSMVCVTLVLHVLAEGGVFGRSDDPASLRNNIQFSEFTPRDLYQLKIWDESPWDYEDGCRTSQGYCQIAGNLQLHLDGFSTVKPVSRIHGGMKMNLFAYSIQE